MSRFFFTSVAAFSFATVLSVAFSSFSTIDEPSIVIRKTQDFGISGSGSAANWSKTAWHAIPARGAAREGYSARVKILYSTTGLYFLYNCPDKKITATMTADFLDLWNEDVVEVFIQPDSKKPQYLEYELSPLNYELPILIYNDSGRLNSWTPFHYNNDQKTRHATSVEGGSKESGAAITSWTAEFFIPYKIMNLIGGSAPRSGVKWKGNLFRIDYDNNAESLFSWQLTSGNFHEYKKFGTWLFE